MWRPSARVQVGQLGPNTFTLPGMRARPTGQRLLGVVAALAAACASFPALVPCRGYSRRVIACAGAWCSLGQQSTTKEQLWIGPSATRLALRRTAEANHLHQDQSPCGNGQPGSWRSSEKEAQDSTLDRVTGSLRKVAIPGVKGSVEWLIPLRWPAVCGRVV